MGSLYNSVITGVDILLIVTLLICCYTDLRSNKIYNDVLIPAVVVAFVLSYINGGLDGCFNSLKGLLLGIALLLIPFARGGIGAGDVKLLGTIGAFKGPEFVLTTFLAGAITGGIFAILMLVKQGRLMITLKKIYFLFLNKVLHIPISVSFKTLDAAVEGESFPYALAIGIGVVWAFFRG
jgi:prepilin peptidase CpaA